MITVNELTPKITLYPRGPDSRGELLVFSSKMEKDEYLRKEFYYCLLEQDKYITAANKDLRKKYKKAYLDKRITFAKLSGYKKSKDGYWHRDMSKGDMVA